MPDTNMNDAQKLFATTGFQSKLSYVIKSKKGMNLWSEKIKRVLQI